MSNYADIITRTRPSTFRRRMPLADRAKIFAPFAALKGFEDCVREKEKVLVPRTVISDYAHDTLDRQLKAIERGEVVTVEYFHAEKQIGEFELGMCQTVTDAVVRVDPITQTLTLSKKTIPFSDIQSMKNERLDAMDELNLMYEV